MKPNWEVIVNLVRSQNTLYQYKVKVILTGGIPGTSWTVWPEIPFADTPGIAPLPKLDILLDKDGSGQMEWDYPSSVQLQPKGLCELQQAI